MRFPAHFGLHLAWLTLIAYALHGVRPTLLERDFNFPPLGVLLDEVGRIRELQQAARPQQRAHG